MEDFEGVHFQWKLSNTHTYAYVHVYSSIHIPDPLDIFSLCSSRKRQGDRERERHTHICTHTYTYSRMCKLHMHMHTTTNLYTFPINLDCSSICASRHNSGEASKDCIQGGVESYGVATMSRLLKIIGLFCRIWPLLYGSFAKETYNLKELTNRSHPMGCLIPHHPYL